MFRDAIDRCLKYDENHRIEVDQLLKHKMFGICNGLTTNVLRMKTTSKSQPRKSLPLYNKVGYYGHKKIKRPIKNMVLNPYVSAFSKPLNNRYFLPNDSMILYL